MRADEVREYIVEHDAVDTILTSIGCHSITHHGTYWTCANQDGDNKQAIVVYDGSLSCVNYTRTIAKGKKATDLFDLVMFNEGLTFPEALKFVCEQLGLDYYKPVYELPESITILQMLHKTFTGGSFDLESRAAPLKPISESILRYYLPYGNRLFEQDGISLDVQQEFGIGYDPESDRITIPIRDSVGALVGVKGRALRNDGSTSKYTYLEKCSKGQLLYGFYENRGILKKSSRIYVFEAEKGVLQAASYGCRNCVATGGKQMTATQTELLVRTCCTPVLAFDKDVSYQELETLASNFGGAVDVYAVYDKEGLLKEKESPTDRQEIWQHLIEHDIFLITPRKKEGGSVYGVA